MMTYDKWVEGQNNPDKLKALKADSDLADIPPEDILVDCNMENDINIEVGKIYLAFMCRNDSSNFENEYVIQGFQYGLRELQEPNSAAAAQSAVELKVKNNMTGAWESISANRRRSSCMTNNKAFGAIASEALVISSSIFYMKKYYKR